MNIRVSSLFSRFPLAAWVRDYDRSLFSGDLLAGVIVSIVLLPQAMAYAMLAGLPPQLGLYSCIVPILLYALLGTSRTLAVGPVGLMSLMVASAIDQFQLQSISDITALAFGLALISGGMLVMMHVFRFGAVMNFISHPVLSGFTSAGALMIAFSQFRHLLGITGNGERSGWMEILQSISPQATLIGVCSIALMLMLKMRFTDRLLKGYLPPVAYSVVSRSGPLVCVLAGIGLVQAYELDQNASLAIVGEIPPGLPAFSLPAIDWLMLKQVIPLAFVIAIVGFLESVSVAKALASRRRQKISANQELLALGCANIGSAFSGGYPVAGGLGRSMVNFSAGANTQVSSLITAVLIAVSLLFLTPLLYFLPKAVLAAIIIVAVMGLFDVQSFRHVWAYDRSEGICQLATFVAVLVVGIEWGILIGAMISIGFHLHRSSEPHIAIVGRLGDTEHFRNIERHEVETCSRVVLLRVDENLYFANTAFLEDYIMQVVAENREASHLVLICSAVNAIDSSALELLDTLVDRLRYAGVTLHLAEVKGPVMDQLEKTPFLANLAPGRVFLSTHEAMNTLEATAE